MKYDQKLNTDKNSRAHFNENSGQFFDKQSKPDEAPLNLNPAKADLTKETSEEQSFGADADINTYGEKTVQNNFENQTGDTEVTLGNTLLTDFPQGVSIMIYDAGGGEFKTESEQWAKRNNAIGIKGTSFNVQDIVIGKAIPNQINRQNSSNEDETIFIDTIITELGSVLGAAVKKAGEIQKLNNPGYVANEQAPKIKTLAIGSHGWCSGTSAGINEDNYANYFKTMSPYLTANVNVILFACNTATAKDIGVGNWSDLSAGGKDSLAANVRDQLAESGHKDARVWGHTATGHFLDTWPLRYFDASANGQDGESYFDYIFKSQFKTIEEEVLNEITLKNYTISDPEQSLSIKENVRKVIYPFFYKAYQSAMNTQKLEQTTNGVTEKVNLAEAAPTQPDDVALIVKNIFESNFKSKLPTALKIAETIIPKIKPQLKKKE